MSLQFIFGNSGSGKSCFLYQKIIGESRRHPEQSYLVIVPEQFTMQTQRDLVMMHPDRGIMNIDVLSFRRLAHRVFEETGADRRTVMTETGKSLMLRRVAEQQKEQLKVLGARMNRTGYVSEVKSMLSELMQYEISDPDLEDILRSVENRPLLHAKLTDIRVLYRAFLDYQRERFMKPEELMEVLAHMAGRSELLKHSVLAFDGFAGFTPSQLTVLEELLVVCPMVYVTVTIDARESFFGEIREYELFAPSRRLIKSVSDRCRSAMERAGVSQGGYEEPIVLGPHGENENRKRNWDLPRFSENGALRHLEQNLFRKVQTPYPGDSGELSLHVCSTPAQEVHFVARTISRLVREEQYRYRDIAVIAGDLSAYGNYVKNIFPLYGIPAFIDETKGLLLNPCLEFVRGALELVQQDFSRESVFRLLRTGMAGLSSDETDRLENYVVAAGIRGRKRWEEEWTWCPLNLSSVILPENSGDRNQVSEPPLTGLALYNSLRVRFMERMGTFAEEMQRKNRTLSEYVRLLYQLLTDCGVQQLLKDRENEFYSAAPGQGTGRIGGSSDAGLASEYRQVYPLLIGLLDEMVDLLGEERMDCKEFSEILDAGLFEAKIGIIPPGIDQVQVGDIRRSRLANVKVLFFTGLNDGWVPARGDEGGIISDTEREILLDAGASLAPSARENSYIQRFYLYQNLTKPQDRLCLSWCQSSGDGTAMRPSYLISAVCRLFPDLGIHQEKDAGMLLSGVTSKENGMLYLLHGLQTVRESDRALLPWLELFREYLGDAKYSSRVRELTKAAFLRGKIPGTEILRPQMARELYGLSEPDAGRDGIPVSVTRLEQFAGCAFSHFASYGLHLREREEYGVEAADLGTLFHESIELFSRQMLAEGCDWGECSYEEQAERMDRCVERVAGVYEDGILHQNARAEYTIRRLKRILRRTVWVMRSQIRAGQFRPVGFEISFADTADLNAVQVRLGENEKIRLQGRIDRIDTVETEDAVYVKVVDYKSGMTQFDPVSLYYGMQLQLVVYLNAAIEMEQKLHPRKKIIPAGIFYHRMQDPVLEKEEDPEHACEAFLKKMRPNGLVNGDGPILRLFDNAISGDSLVIPVGLKKDGTPKAVSALVTTEQMNSLSEYVTALLTKMCEAILDGEIEAHPYTDKNRNACEYCAYADVCGMDRKIPGRCEKRTPQLTASEVWELLPTQSVSEWQERHAAEQSEGAVPELLPQRESPAKKKEGDDT